VVFHFDEIVMCTMRKVTFSLLFALTSHSYAADIVKCSPEEEKFVREIHAAKRLSNESLVAEANEGLAIKEWLQCELKDDVMMDGLSFTLYKRTKSKVLFVRIYNNFDGTSKLYGPFNK
jgi:hypothetical protein